MKAGIWTYIKQYRFKSIFTRCFFKVMLWITLPLILIDLAIYYSNKETSKREVLGIYSNALDKSGHLLDQIFYDVDRLATILSMNDNVVKFAAMDPFERINYDGLSYLTDMGTTIPMYLVLHDYISSVYVYFERSDFIYSTADGYSYLNELNDVSWLKEYQEIPSTYVLHPTTRTISNGINNTDQFITLIKRCGMNGKEYGLVFNLNIKKLKSMVDPKVAQLETFMATDSVGHIFYSSESTYFGKNLNDIETETFFDYLNNKYQTSSASIIKSQKGMDFFNWNSILFVHESEVNIQLVKTLPILLVGIFVSILFSILVSWSIASWLYKAIRVLPEMLTDEVKIYGEAPEKSSFGELNEMINKIRSVGKRNSEMKQELSQSLVQLYQAQALALQSQINPHFLFNTLDSISWKAMALTGGENDVVDMVGTLSRLLRYSTEHSSIMHSIEFEREQMQLYVKIMQYRKKDRFEFIENIEEDCLDYLVPKFIIQPLVENAITHGMGHNRGKGQIELHIKQEESNIRITVKDNGIGMSENQIIYLKEQLLEKSKDKHIGLFNVNKRLQLLYGLEYGIEINSTKFKETEISILVPKSKVESKNNIHQRYLKSKSDTYHQKRIP